MAGAVSVETVSRIPVRYAETDRMGVVHHSLYPVYFEVGRTEFFQEHLRPYEHYEAEGVLAPVLRYEVDLVGPATYGDVLILTTRPGWLKGVRLSMTYQIVLESNPQPVVASGSSVHALVGPDRKPVHPRRMGRSYLEIREVFGS